jgi:hypothetical protein
MGRRPFPLQQASRAEHQRAGADAGDVARALRLPPDEVEGFRVVHQRIHAGAARHADQIELRTLGKGHARQDLHAAARGHRRAGLPNQMHLGIWKLDENLIRPRQVELGDIGEQQ